MIAGVTRLARFAWGVLAYNLAVILWGAYVRATGSGAGCGAHWPLCNGEVIPRGASVTTLVEFSHRASSGMALLLVVALLVWTRRARPTGDSARTGAVWTVVFMLTEAAVGAGLVLFELVADNASMARAMFMAVHLTNTFALVAAMTLTASWLSGGPTIDWRGRRGTAAVLAVGVAGLLLVGTSGAVAALGDTLYPSASLAEALRADLSPASHLMIRLRILHPAMAVVVGFALIVVAPRLPSADNARGRRVARAVAVIAAVQLAVGTANVMLLAPVWMQMVHLLLADALWITFVLLAGAVLATSRRPLDLDREA
jgi:heme A synthase